jgi:5-methylcytosine-specific restriction enzyme subunit McrC
MRRILDLREEEVRRFPRAMLLDTEVLALTRSEKFEVEPASLFNGFTYGLRSRGWVGQIPIGDDLLVRISPKVPIDNLFRMLEVAYNLRSFRGTVNSRRCRQRDCPLDNAVGTRRCGRRWIPA